MARWGMKDYSKWKCPFCHKTGIVQVGEPIDELFEDKTIHKLQLFDHPDCENHDRFKGFYHDIIEVAE
jgi:hypothetical protein